jgi:hypothetical protein
MTKKEMQTLIDNLSEQYWAAYYAFRFSESSELGDKLERLIERFNRLFPSA